MIDYRTPPAQGTQMIDRTILLLRLVATFCPKGVRLTDLSQEAGLPAPTVRRILKRLVQHGVIAQDQTGHRYSLGHFARELGLAPGNQHDTASRYRPLVERFVAETGATGYLVMRSDLDSLCIVRVDPPQASIHPAISVGDRLPLGVGVGGMLLLACLPEQDAARVIALNQPVYKRFVRATGASFSDHLDAARRDGHVARRSPVTAGVVGLGVPLPAVSGPAVLALVGAFDVRNLEGDLRAATLARMKDMVRAHCTA